MQRKDLHLATRLEDLSEKFEVDVKVWRTKPIEIVLTSLNKLFEEADKHRIERDEELSYVFYMRAMNLLTKIQNRPDYQNEKQLIAKKVGNNAKMNKHFEEMSKLQNSLRERYALKYPKAVTPPPAEIDDIEPAIDSNESMEVRQTIDCMQLYKLIEEGAKILIMDCRPEEDYDQSKISYQYTLNVPEKLIAIGMTASKIQQRLPNESKVYWEMRGNRNILIFVDWYSARFNRNSSIWHLKEILMQWDQELDKKPEMLCLEGGYDKWKTMYPMKCINPQFPSPRTENGDAPELDGIEYPNFDDIQMKDDSFKPQVDRSKKESALKAYTEKKTPFELVEKKKELLDKSLQNQKELMNVEEEINNIANDKENDVDCEQKEQSLKFQYWELLSKQNDIDVKGKTIDEQFDKSKSSVKEQEKSKLAQVEAELARKEQERQKIIEERERTRKNRQEALNLARQNKPASLDHRTPPKVQRKEELILSPKGLSNVMPPSIPSFDRSAKPQITTRYIYSDEDFSPSYGRVERGLTGLKNLGNTCYMNSIIQCLSNTNTLTQYLLDNNYEKHLNRSNKTKGHIVRTLAAVIKMLWNGECKHISSKHLKAVIGEQDSLFYGTEQQDSHEFLIMLIDWLQSDLQTIPVQSSLDSLPASEKAWLEYTKCRESFILRLFYGQIKSTVKCTVCMNESATYETFSNLSLELPPNNIEQCHINECFNMYFHGERVHGWNCPNCKQPRDAIKKLDISKLPPVLVIHLKRFYADPYSNSTFRKKTIYVDFPLTDMSMLPYVARSEKNNGSNSQHIYNLYAVSNHYGSMDCGHYTAFCRNYGMKKWYKYDDHTVTPLDKTDVKSSATYILFYTSLSETALNGGR